MRRWVSTSRRQLRKRLLEQARAAGVPPHAPLGRAEEVAGDALRRGASLDEAGEAAWTWLGCWLRHPANSASGSLHGDARTAAPFSAR